MFIRQPRMHEAPQISLYSIYCSDPRVASRRENPSPFRRVLVEVDENCGLASKHAFGAGYGSRGNLPSRQPVLLLRVRFERFVCFFRLETSGRMHIYMQTPKIACCAGCGRRQVRILGT